MNQQMKNIYGEEYFRAHAEDRRRRVWYQEGHQRIIRMKSGGAIFDVGRSAGHFLELFDWCLAGRSIGVGGLLRFVADRERPLSVRFDGLEDWRRIEVGALKASDG